MFKHNPVNEWLAPIYEKVLQPLIKRNFFHQAVGGIEEGSYLCSHPLVDNIHITGSDKTHDAILWGGLDKKAAPEPKLKKLITSELGCVTPVSTSK
jgi:acyl-CoA reductase-like NAD-dependent aldehyde dehydrogenase